MNQKAIQNILSQAFIGIMLIVTGFVFGLNTGKTQATKELEPQVLGEKTSVVVEALEVPGVSFIQPGTEPICPDTHPLKAKFKDNIGIYYMPDHQNYSRVVAWMCLANEEFAKEKGFFRKF